MDNKKCYKCGQLKKIELFYKDSSRKDGYSFLCKECKNKHVKKYQKNNRTKKLDYNKVYYKKNKEIFKFKRVIYEKTSNGVWNSFKGKSRKSEININKEDFIKWWESQQKICSYCGFSYQRINEFLKKNEIKRKSNRLEIDRKDNKKTYEIKNMILACTLCNNHKKDFFSYDQFKKIAKKFIIPKIKT